MSIKAFSWALDRDIDNTPGIDATSKLILLELAEGAHKTDDCVWIGRAELARAALVKSVRTVDARIDWLIGGGLLVELDPDALTAERAAEYRSLRPGHRPRIFRVNWRTARGAGSAPWRGAATRAPLRGAARVH
ncbi:MAG: hypothetical protein R2695_04020 [Acidimicrobiales bacterium]